jgi:hypothetical protein
MSADGDHFESRSGSLNTILEVDHLRTISLKPVSQFKANMAWMVLKWSIFKIVSSDPDLHARWSADCGHFEPRSGSLNTILEVDLLRTIDDMFAILAY